VTLQQALAVAGVALVWLSVAADWPPRYVPGQPYPPLRRWPRWTRLLGSILMLWAVWS
jgi:hypothetical protein